jgi:hypothetical protein
MEMPIYVGRRAQAMQTRLYAALLSCRDVARLQSDCDSLLSLADRLEALAADVHLNKRSEEAQLLVSRLRREVSDHLEKEGVVMRAIEAADDPSLIEAMERTRAEHVAMGKLTVAVIRGLRAIGKKRLPTRLSGFVMATGILCEFMRMHVQFKKNVLYPQLSRRLVH